MKIQIPDVTLLAYDTRPEKIDGTILALQKCCEQIDFHSAKLLTDIEPKNLPKNIKWEYAPHINHIDDFNYYMFLELGKHVDSSHCLYVQDHGYILNPDLWDNDWLQWDYCGAPWPLVENAYLTDAGRRIRVGNGGFSLRSRKLLFAPKELGLELEQRQQFYNEDGNICVYQADKLLKYGIKYMPLKEASIFSYENPILENNYGNASTFGYHRNKPVIKK
jgi:hypothetical protein